MRKEREGYVTEAAKVQIESFVTMNGQETIAIRPSESRRKKPSWYIWMKADGSGILVIDSQKTRVELPANGATVPWAPSN